MTENKRIYDSLDFKNKNVLRKLLYFQAYFKHTGYISEGGAYNRVEPQQNLYSNLIDVYIDLEQLIQKTELTDKNKELLKLIQDGHSLSYIYKNVDGYERETTKKMYQRIIERMADKQREIENGAKEV